MQLLMERAADKIKYGYIGYKVKKQYKEMRSYERDYVSVKWIGPGKTIELIGNMTNPPWTLSLKMDYCTLRGIHVKYFSKLKEGTYYYNYIVDGRICVDTSQSAISYMRLKCNQFKVGGGCRVGTLSWYDFEKMPLKLEDNYVTKQSAFQVKDFAETPEEYDFFNKLVRKPKVKSKNSNKPNNSDTEPLFSLKGLNNKVVHKDTQEKIRKRNLFQRLNPAEHKKDTKRQLNIKLKPNTVLSQSSTNYRMEERYETKTEEYEGRAYIDFNMAYDNYEY